MQQHLFVALLLSSLAAAYGGTLRGLNPDVASHYSGSGGTFTCISGSTKTIPFARVNDDYCDCPDGSDEPGTSACHNGRFYCRNLGHEPRLLASAFVDDGVCDCCDGTDEPKGKCQNTCLQAGAVHREALKGKILQYEQTLAKKAEFVSNARSFKEELQRKSATINDDIAAKQAEVNLLKEEVSRVEAEEAARRAEEEQQRAAQRAAEEQAAQERAAQEQAASAEGAAAEQEPLTTGAADGQQERELQEQAQQEQAGEREETPEERGRRIASQWTNDPESAAVLESVRSEEQQEGSHEEQQEEEVQHYENDNHGDYDRGVEMGEGEYESENQPPPPPPRPEGQAAAAGRQRGELPVEPVSEWDDFMMFLDLVKEWAMKWIRIFGKVWKEGIRNDVLEHREKMRHQQIERLKQQLQRQPQQEQEQTAANVGAVPAAAVSRWLSRRRRGSTKASEPAVATSPLGEVRARLYDAERALERLNKDKEDIETYLHRRLNFGPDDIFLAFANKCFTSYQTRWTYEACPFKQAVQREGYSNSVTVGRWYGFSHDYQTMYFTGGDECAGVGRRSFTVSMECGHENKLSDGEEPATCQYTAKLATPALCGEAQLEELRQQLRNLEAFEEEVRALLAKEEAGAGVKDEL